MEFVHFFYLGIEGMKYLFIFLELQAKKQSAWFVIVSLPKMKLLVEKWVVVKIASIGCL
jgi:hypothetical protein